LNMAFKEGKSPRLFLKGYYNALHQGVKYFFIFPQVVFISPR
jgi:hypothetical protein